MSPVRPGRTIILLLAAVAALGSLATQLLVPALPEVARDLQVGPASAQLVIGSFLVGLGAGQLLVGPLADRFGRRQVLLAGLALYALASAAAAFAATLPLLLAARLVQALGASAGIVTARVLVNDIFPRAEAASRQATLMAVVLVSPALAPAIGGALSEVAGWRSVFALLAAAGAGALLLAWRLIAVPPVAEARAPARLLRDLAGVARNPAFQGAAGAIAAGSAALYMFLGTAPFLLAHDHGLGPHETGWCMMAVAGASIGGTFLVRRIDAHGHGLRTGAWLLAAASVAMIAAHALWPARLAALLVPMALLGLGAGLIGPCGIARVLRTAPGREATAVSLSGAAQMLVSALAQYLLGQFAPVSAAQLGVAIAISAATCLLATLRHARHTAEGAMQGLA